MNQHKASNGVTVYLDSNGNLKFQKSHAVDIAEDVHVATGVASTADPYRELHPSQAESIARAVLGAIGSVDNG